MYYAVIKHSRHLRTLEKCRKHSPACGWCFLHFPHVLKCPSCFITVYYIALSHKISPVIGISDSVSGRTAKLKKNRISLRWLTYIVNSVDKTKLSCNTPTYAATQFLTPLNWILFQMMLRSVHEVNGSLY